MNHADDLAHVHAALRKCEGERKRAAKELGMTEKELNLKISNNEYLAFMWQRAKGQSRLTPPGKEEVLTRQQEWDREHPVIPMTVVRTEDAVNGALVTLNQSLNEGGMGKGLNFSKAEIDYALSLQEFMGGHAMAVQDIVLGSVVQLAVKVGHEANRLLNILKQGYEEDEEGAKRTLTLEEKILMRGWFLELCEEARKECDMMHRGIGIKGALELRRKELEEAKNGGGGKPGWRPPGKGTTILSTGPVTVTNKDG